MIPEIGAAGPITTLLAGDSTLESAEVPSLTYRMDWDGKRILSHVDALKAVEQAAVKILRTDRYEHLIYSSNYGTEWNLVLGKDRLLARSEIKRIVSEALLQDERITALEALDVAFIGDALNIYCNVITRYGNFQLRKELKESV